jgi:hypothetical protein
VGPFHNSNESVVIAETPDAKTILVFIVGLR